MERQILKLSSKIENIVKVEKLIDDICNQLQIGEDIYGNILVALTEAVNNAIRHGNKSDPKKSILISVFSNPDEKILMFNIKDEGPGFDFENIPDPTSPENIEKPDGRGVFLMKNLADKVEFFDQGKEVTLSFNINASN